MAVHDGDDDQGRVHHRPDREVDPAHEQDEQLAEGDDAEHRALLHEDVQVLRAVEVRLEHREQRSGDQRRPDRHRSDAQPAARAPPGEEGSSRVRLLVLRERRAARTVPHRLVAPASRGSGSKSDSEPSTGS